MTAAQNKPVPALLRTLRIRWWLAPRIKYTCPLRLLGDPLGGQQQSKGHLCCETDRGHPVLLGAGVGMMHNPAGQPNTLPLAPLGDGPPKPWPGTNPNHKAL